MRQLEKQGRSFVILDASERIGDSWRKRWDSLRLQKPYTPEFARELHASTTQLHSSDYRNLSQLQEGPVLVVGAAHSGSDIAYEAAASHGVILSGTDTGQIPVPIESRRGRMLDVRNVVWCTGFRPDFSWVPFPLEVGDDAYPAQYRGAAASSPGLYFVGLPFLHSFASMLIAGAGRDAERVARHIVKERATQLDVEPDEVALATAS